MHGDGNWFVLEFYVVGSGKMWSKDAIAYTQSLAAKYAASVARLEVRPDPWFIGEIWRPFFPHFDTSDSVPTEKAFRKTKTLSCLYNPPMIKGECTWEGSARLP